MIVASPRGITRSEYTLADSHGPGEPFGEVSLRFFGGGRLTVGDQDFDLRTTDWTQTRVALVYGGVQVALANRPSIWRRRYEITAEPEITGLAAPLVLGLAVDGWAGRSWTLDAGGVDAGRADWRGTWRANLEAAFSDAVPLVVRSFVVAVLVAERRRQGRHS